MLRAMDPIAIAFYALVCGALGALAPRLPRLPVRLAIGAAVGVVAASVLPLLKALMQV